MMEHFTYSDKGAVKNYSEKYLLKSELAEWIKSGRKKTLTEIAQEADDYLANRKRGNR
jgi:hypothetical protein